MAGSGSPWNAPCCESRRPRKAQLARLVSVVDGLSSEAIALWTLVATVVSGLILYFFVSPRDQHANQAARLTALENAHQALALRFENSHATHDESLNNLTESIDRLTRQIERLETHMLGKGAQRGR